MMKKKITLGIINPSDLSKKSVSGGSSGFLSSILPYLNSKQTIIFGIGKNSAIPWKRYHIETNVKFVPIVNLNFQSKIPMRLKVLIYYILYRNRILNSGVDVLYIHMPECCLPFLKNCKGIPIIYHKHGSANPVARSKFKYGRAILFKKFYEIVLNNIYKSAQWVIAIDRHSFQESNARGAKDRTSLLMNAIDTRKFYPDATLRDEARDRFSLKKTDFAILFVGRIERTKGPGRLINCIPLLNKTKWTCHMFFAGEGSYKSTLDCKFKAMHCSKNVTFLGHVDHEELLAYYNMADVLVLPSDTEGVPMVILEALACGTPVVASNVGGIPDLIRNEVNGTILNDLTPDTIVSAITNILLKQLDRELVSKSVEPFSVSRFLESFDIIVSNVLSFKKYSNNKKRHNEK